MTKHTKITIETDSLLVLRGRIPLRAWCPECGDEGEIIPLDEVGVVSNLPPAEVRAWMESEDLHHTTTADGALMICLKAHIDLMLRSVPRIGPRKRPGFGSPLVSRSGGRAHYSSRHADIPVLISVHK
jgi:hypothetical protein